MAQAVSRQRLRQASPLSTLLRTSWVLLCVVAARAQEHTVTQYSLGASDLVEDAIIKPAVEDAVEKSHGRGVASHLQAADVTVDVAAVNSSIPPFTNYRYADTYFAICTVVKDQGEDIREFIDYHRWIGVGKIYIYDHNSSVPLINLLQDYIQAGLVEYTLFSGHHYIGKDRTFKGTAQGYAYRQCLANARRRHRWLAFIDPDEFIILRQQLQARPAGTQPDINTFMHDYERYGALGLNWRIFGTSGRQFKPEKGVLASYHKCTPENSANNQHIKSIVNVQYTVSIGGNPHAFRYWKHVPAVNEGFVPITDNPALSPFSKPASTQKIALYHYVTKSMDEYSKKMLRGGGSGSVKSIEFLQAVDKESTDDCTDALPLWDYCCSTPPPIAAVDSNRKDNALDDD